MIIQVQGGKVKYLSGNATQYDGEKIPGDLRTWDYLGTDPNNMLTWTYDVLSQRSTTLYHTHPPVTSAINKQTQYAIGPGLKFRSQMDWEMLGKTKSWAKGWGMQFQKIVHYVFEILNFYEKQSILFRTAFVMGDSLLFFDRTLDDDMPFDLIESGGDQINFQGKPKDKSKSATLGIIHDKALRRQGVILCDGENPSFKDENGDQNLIQFYNKQMARQLRGFPAAYRIIAAAKNNDRWWDSTLQRLVMETIMLGYANEDSPESELYDQSEKLAEIAKADKASVSETSETTLTRVSGISEQSGGGIYSLKGKGSIQFTDLKTPSNNFDKVQSAYIEVVGMGTDTPPEVILSKYSTSYTAHKGAFNDFIKSYMMNRKKFINTVGNPTVLEIAKWAIMQRLIDMPHPDFFESRIIQQATIAGNWLGPVPGHINPQQEVTAKKTAVEEAFELRSNVALEYGNEWDNFLEEWQQEAEEFQEYSPEKQAAVTQNEMQTNDNQTDEEIDNQNQDENQGGDEE